MVRVVCPECDYAKTFDTDKNSFDDLVEARAAERKHRWETGHYSNIRFDP